MTTTQPVQNNIDSKQPVWLDSILEKSKRLPHQGYFEIEGLKINIHSYDPETYHWIEKYLYPLNLSSSSDTQLTYSVNTLHSDELVQSVLSSIENSEIDTRRISNARRYLDRIFVDKQITIDCDPFYGMLWVTDRSTHTITLVLSVKVRWPLLEISRVVRDLITRSLEDQGWILFHAGAIHTGEKNYMIIGDASAGKTSLIIALLASGSTFISNERVFVKVENGEARLLSFPMPIAVGLGTMVQYPELIKFIRQPQFCLYPPRRINISKVHDTAERKWPNLRDKIQFLPQEITGLFADTAGIPGGKIHGLIVPSWQKNQAVKLESLNHDRIKRVLKYNCIDRSRDDIYPPWMPLPFQQPALDDVNSTISFLVDLPSIKFKFSGDKNRRNEIGTYSKLLHEKFSVSF
jgi:hypothetical protein